MIYNKLSFIYLIIFLIITSEGCTSIQVFFKRNFENNVHQELEKNIELIKIVGSFDALDLLEKRMVVTKINDEFYQEIQGIVIEAGKDKVNGFFISLGDPEKKINGKVLCFFSNTSEKLSKLKIGDNVTFIGKINFETYSINKEHTNTTIIIFKDCSFTPSSK